MDFWIKGYSFYGWRLFLYRKIASFSVINKMTGIIILVKRYNCSQVFDSAFRLK